MAKHDRKGRSKTRPEDRWSGLPNAVLNHEAVRSLGGSAFKVLIYLAKRCYGVKNNGKIVFGVRCGCLIFNVATQEYEEHSIGLGKSTIARALLELERRGLIICMMDSTFDQKRLSCEYRLTWMKTEDGLPTNEWMGFREGGKKAKRSPTHGTVGAAIVPPAGQPTKPARRKSALQSHQPDCSDAHSPTHGTRSYHVYRDNDPVPQFGSLTELIEAVRTENDRLPETMQ